MEDSNASPGTSTTAKAIVESVFRYKRRLLGSFLTVMGLVALYVLLAPRQYQSEMAVLVRNARPDYQITPERSNGTLPQTEVTEERINSEIEVLKSRDVADRVVDPTWNSADAERRDATQIKAHDKAVAKLNKHLKVELLRKSNVIHVAFDARSPQEATGTVERVLAAFLLKQHELERSSGASSFFANEQERYKRDLDAAQQQLAAFQQSRQIVSLPDKEKALEQQIVDLQQQERAASVLIGDLERRLKTGEAQLATTPQRLTTMQKSVPNILAMEQLGTMLTTYKNQRTALLTKFPATDRLVLEVDQQIANTGEALRQAREVNPSENSTEINPVWQQVSSAKAQNTADLSAARAHRATLAEQLAGLRKTLTETEGSTVEFNTLQARVTELQGNYQLYTEKRNEAQVANAMDQQQLVNVAIAERPTFSATPSSPKIAMTLAMGSFAALFFAACAIFFAEMGRDTIAAPFELERLSNVPVLATMPLLEAALLPSQSSAAGGRKVESAARTGRAGGLVQTPLGAHRSRLDEDAVAPETTGGMQMPEKGIA